MKSETDDPEPDPVWKTRRDPEFTCREQPPPGSDDGAALRAILYGLPLRIGFTEEVLARIRDS